MWLKCYVRIGQRKSNLLLSERLNWQPIQELQYVSYSYKAPLYIQIIRITNNFQFQLNSSRR